MKCTVKVNLKEISCPGTLHLQDRNPVFLVVHLFGCIQRSQPVYPSFPMVFETKLKFERIFTNAKSPEQVLEILEDERALIELKQERKQLPGGFCIARFEEVARKFLFPSESCVPRTNELKREIFLEKTEYFNGGKALNPQLSFKTTTKIEFSTEQLDYFVPVHSKEVHLELKSADNERRKKSTKKKKRTGKSPTSGLALFERVGDVSGGNALVNESKFGNSIIAKSKKSDQSKTSNGNTCKHSKTPNKQHEKSKTLTNKHKHCICECPELEDTDIQMWLELNKKGILPENQPEPFRAGKEPLNLIAKRDFKTDDTTNTKKRKKKRKGFCPDCAVPSKDCVLCNAYKTVYGKEKYLSYRFQSQDHHLDPTNHEKHGKVHRTPKSTKKMSQSMATEIPLVLVAKRNTGRVDSSSIFHHLPSSTPTYRRNSTTPKYDNYLGTPSKSTVFPTRAERPSTSSSSNDSLHGISAIKGHESSRHRYEYHRQSLSEQTPILRSQHSNSYSERCDKLGRAYHTVVASPMENFDEETRRIHARIKELMRKNDSILQHEISSSSSESEDFSNSEDEQARYSFRRMSVDDGPQSTSSHNGLPARSIVVPVGAHDSWSVGRNPMEDGESHRDVFDSSLKKRYAELYEKTVNNR